MISSDLSGHDALIAADAVIVMNDIVAFIKILIVIQLDGLIELS